MSLNFSIQHVLGFSADSTSNISELNVVKVYMIMEILISVFLFFPRFKMACRTYLLKIVNMNLSITK